MKFGIRTPSLKKKLQAHSPIAQAKRKYSTKKYTNPIETVNDRLYNKVYKKTTVGFWETLRNLGKKK